MLTRRTVLLAPLAAYAQTRPDTIVFTRAYVACPDRQYAQWSLEHGRFPHARPTSPSLWDFLKPADVTISTMYGGDGYKEPSVHVPLAITWPGRLPARSIDILCSHVDVMPTLLSLAGIAIPKEVQGRDLTPFLRDEAARRAPDLPAAVYIEGSLGKRDEWRALIRGYDKLIWNLKDDIIGLYNLSTDPDESDELRRNKEHRLTRDSMWALAQQWMAKLQDGRDAQGFRTRR
jgi:arylsulfatase A-like enzyme